MDKELERSISKTLSLGIQQIRMLIIESHITIAKQESKINDEQYETYRQVADKHWNNWSKKVAKLNSSVASGKEETK